MNQLDAPGAERQGVFVAERDVGAADVRHQLVL
jgi:hypothetical protein